MNSSKITKITYISEVGQQREMPVTGDNVTQTLVAQCIPTNNGADTAPPELLIVANKVFEPDVTEDIAFKLLQKRVSVECRVTLFDQNATNIRRCNNRLYDWIEREPAILVLGLGLTDCGVEKDTGLPKIEPDEFELRVAWLIGKLNRETSSRLLWVHAPLKGACLDRAGELLLQPPMQDACAEIARSVCDREGVPFVVLDAVDHCNSIEPKVFFDTISPVLETLLKSGPRQVSAAVGDDRRVVKAVVHYSEGTRLELDNPDKAARIAARLHDYRGGGTISAIRSANDGKSLLAPGGRKPYEQSFQQQTVDWLQERHRPGLKKAMVIGDSVLMRLQSGTGYGLPCYRRLVGHFNLAHIPHHIGGSRSVLNSIENWLSYEPLVLHFNCGLHDLTTLASGDRFPSHVPVDEFADNLQKIVDSIRAHGVSHAIWGTLTPLNEEKYSETLVRSMESIRTYNAAAIDVMNRNSVEINDLCSPLAENDGLSRYYQKDGGHLNREGAELIGKIVAEAMLKYE